MGTELKRYQSFISDSARWLLFEPRPGDIIISTPPKCGTTLAQMLCALLLFDTSEFPGRMDDLSPWLDQRTRSDEEVLTHLRAQTHRRFIKTHTPLDGVPEWPDVTYVAVGRDPRDVFVSWEHHIENMDVEHLFSAIDGAVGFDSVLPFLTESPETVEERFDQWLVDEDPRGRMSLALVAGHIETSWDRRERPNVELFHFEEMRSDRVAAMTRLADAFGLDMSTERIEELADAASIDRMRARADDLAPNTKQIFSDSSRFFRSGEGGDWRSFVTPEQEAIYWQRIDELTSPDLRAWLHGTNG
jgi:aryl sulfotransferase